MYDNKTVIILKLKKFLKHVITFKWWPLEKKLTSRSLLGFKVTVFHVHTALDLPTTNIISAESQPDQE